ncbi:MAG: enoyl-CoA hydratase [Actinomycetia bacterium]|nr:enoyl-CoA hydratase [Actinomycetes bacterium]
MATENVRVEVDGPIATITLARPEKRNALGLEFMQAVIEALNAVPTEVGVVVLTAEGKVFSAGHDLKEMMDRDDAYYSELFATCESMMNTIRDLRQPVIARVQGIATAAGCQLVATCDLAIAADTAWFATPGVKIGLFCHTPNVAVSRSVGPKRAMQMLLTGEPVSADTAVEWGLINQAVPADDLDEAVLELANKILEFSKHTISLGKCTFYAQEGLPIDDAYAIATPVMATNAGNEHAQEGMGAFLDKRKPQWPGQ